MAIVWTKREGISMRIAHSLVALFISSLSLRAADVGEAGGTGEGVSSLFTALWQCAAFGVLGILLVTIGFKLFDAVITKSDLEREVAKGNVAAAILSGAAILAIGIIVAAALH
jgi:putative membrane protein